MSTPMNEFLMPRSEQVPGLTQEDKTWGLFTHLASLSGYIGVPLGNILGPLVIWLIKKDGSKFLDDQGKEALNFQISVTMYAFAGGIIGFILSFIGIGFLIFLLVAAVGLAGIVFPIIAAVKNNKGEAYRYPATLRLIK